jgi:hypothetical protein
MIAILLLQNLKNLKIIWIETHRSRSLPLHITFFLSKLFKNSQSTLENLYFEARDIIFFPTIPLPNLSQLTFGFRRIHNNQIDTFDHFMKNFVDSDMVCENFKFLNCDYMRRVPKILQYMIKNYPNHFLYAPFISTLEHIPLKISFLKLENLAAFRFISQVEYLILRIKNFSTPSAEGWDNYEEITSFCPNLKGITFCHKKTYLPLEPFAESVFPVFQNIWRQRLVYFKSQNIKILNCFHYF